MKVKKITGLACSVPMDDFLYVRSGYHGGKTNTANNKWECIADMNMVVL